MSSACKMVDNASKIIRTLQTKGIGCRTFSRLLKRNSISKGRLNLRNSVENVKLMRKCALLDNGSERRYDDDYGRHYADIYGTSDAGRSEQNRDGPQRNEVPEVDQFDADGPGFDPRYNNMYYRRFKPEENVSKNPEPVKPRTIEDIKRNARHLPSDWYARDYPTKRNDDQYLRRWQDFPERPKASILENDEKSESFELSKKLKEFDAAQKKRWAKRNKSNVNIKMPKTAKSIDSVKLRFKPYNPNAVQQPQQQTHDVTPEQLERQRQRKMRLGERQTAYDERREREREQRHWHRWNNCPDERSMLGELNPEASETQRQLRDRRSGVITKKVLKPKFDSDKRKYQTAPQWETIEDEPQQKPQTIKHKVYSPFSKSAAFNEDYAEYAAEARSQRRYVEQPPPALQMKAYQNRASMMQEDKKVWQYTRADDYMLEPPRRVHHIADSAYHDDAPKLEPPRRVRHIAKSAYHDDAPELEPPRRVRHIAKSDHHDEAPEPSKPSLVGEQSNETALSKHMRKQQEQLKSLTDRTVIPQPKINRMCIGNHCHGRCTPAKSPTEPPRYKMSFNKFQVKRPCAPISSFSERHQSSSRDIHFSEYTGYTKPTCCDVWSNFSLASVSKSKL